MPLRRLTDVQYIPLLSLRPAEMQALEQLPKRDKDLMLPCFSLRPWMSAHHLESSLSRLEDAYGRRPCFVELADTETPDEDRRRPVHDELNALRDPSDGYSAWCDFIQSQPNFIPSVQYTDLNELEEEVESLWSMDRGLFVPLRQPAFPFIANLTDIVSRSSQRGRHVCFLLDYEKATRDILTRQAFTAGLIETILSRAPSAFVAISASSFPDSFVDNDGQDIFERFFFNGIAQNVETEKLIYSDRGSARVERLQGGGSGVIPPRIDYPLSTEWTFFRAANADNKLAGYRAQARAAMRSHGWDPALRLWGTQMIERTALGDTAAIISPARATAARINIHLHRQLFFDDPEAMHDTDEEWTD